MNWDALGAIGEIAGAIAVIATLFFLARQLQVNSRELERTLGFLYLLLALFGYIIYPII